MPSSLRATEQTLALLVGAGSIPKSLHDDTASIYKGQWRNFERWCAAHRLSSLPATPKTVALYVADRHQQDAISHATAMVMLAAVRKQHLDNGHTNPTSDPQVRAARLGLKTLGPAPSKLPKVSVAERAEAASDVSTLAAQVSLITGASSAKLARLTLADLRSLDGRWTLTIPERARPSRLVAISDDMAQSLQALPRRRGVQALIPNTLGQPFTRFGLGKLRRRGFATANRDVVTVREMEKQAFEPPGL